MEENTEIVKKKTKKYFAEGKTWPMKYGSRRQVFNGSAYMTKGKLKQDDIMYNKQKRLVSVNKSRSASKEQRLLRYGYGARKGKFGYVRVSPQTRVGRARGSRRSKRRTKRSKRGTKRSKRGARRSRSTRRKSKRHIA